MAKMDPMAIIMFILRIFPPILFILFILLMFFSFRVAVIGEEMERFNLELSDALAASPLAMHKAVFDPVQLFEAEKKDPNRNIELYARSCDFGYTLELEAIGGKTICEEDSGKCREFCKTVCGLDDSEIQMSAAGTLTGNCGCNIEVFGGNFCECKKDDEWQSGYHWKYGYTPADRSVSVSSVKASFPVGISSTSGVHETTLPAKLTLTSHDSMLTRLACITQKAYETKTKFSTQMGRLYSGYVGVSPSIIFKRTDTDGTHVCIYYRDGPSLGYLPHDCRYMPDLQFEPLELYFDGSLGENEFITAYPVTSYAECDQLKENYEPLEFDTTVSNVVLCVE